MTLRDVKLMAAQLGADDLRKLDQWLHDRLDRLEQEERVEKKSRREVIDVVKKGSWTYQLEAVRCGKEGCHCKDGQGHCPYWYGYRKEGGRTISKYIGKNLTKALE
ncbi:MAG: hypothetical protein HONDAALG_00469 [Gammaproteobacteria bacterium]|nr:hypothetical protein [Gammaproteobacteria bacterium]